MFDVFGFWNIDVESSPLTTSFDADKRRTISFPGVEMIRVLQVSISSTVWIWKEKKIEKWRVHKKTET